MSRLRPIATLALGALVAACGSSGSADPAALGVATIGPRGGLLVVDRGLQQGLVLEVPAGAVTAPTAFRVVVEGDAGSPSAPAGASVPAIAPPLRIEPADLVSPVSMRLRLPYEPDNVTGTGAGNVDVLQDNPWVSRVYDPAAVDASAGWVEVSVKTLGRFEVVAAPTPADRRDYLPAPGLVATLEGGMSFAVEDELASSPLAGAGVTALSIVGPAVDEQVVVAGSSVFGRRGGTVWVEEWINPYDPFEDPGVALSNMQPQTAYVTNLLASSTLGATVLPLGYFQYALPIQYDGQLFTDIGKLILNVAYDRADLGVGERQLVMWLSPEAGLLRLSVDGVSYDRLP